jgi:hypothetical protein
MIFSDLASSAEAGFAKAGNRCPPSDQVRGQAFSGSCSKDSVLLRRRRIVTGMRGLAGPGGQPLPHIAFGASPEQEAEADRQTGGRDQPWQVTAATFRAAVLSGRCHSHFPSVSRVAPPASYPAEPRAGYLGAGDFRQSISPKFPLSYRRPTGRLCAPKAGTTEEASYGHPSLRFAAVAPRPGR